MSAFKRAINFGYYFYVVLNWLVKINPHTTPVSLTACCANYLKIMSIFISNLFPFILEYIYTTEKHASEQERKTRLKKKFPKNAKSRLQKEDTEENCI